MGFDGRIHHLEHGYRLKFDIKRVAETVTRPHGLRYAFTLHDPEGRRLMGFDNAHGVEPLGGRYVRAGPEHDHWHRTGSDPGRPYAFATAEQLIEDFFAEVKRVLDERGIGETVIGEGTLAERNKS